MIVSGNVIEGDGDAPESKRVVTEAGNAHRTIFYIDKKQNCVFW